MAAEIKFQENSSFSEKHPQERLYQLNAAIESTHLLFGFLYVNPELSTLIWQGSLDFTLLEQEALDRLPRVIRSGSLRQLPEAGTLEETASASFILEAEELHVHSLTQVEQYHQYSWFGQMVTRF